MDGKGSDSLLKTSKVTEWTFNNGGYVSLFFGGFLLLGVLVAYVIAVARGNVDPFLPLISDAAGSPPQNGLFGTLLSLGGMLGVVFMLLRYMIVLEQNQEKSKVVSILNKLALFFGIASMCGITLVTGYPVNFYRNREVWLMDVGIPHMIGGVMLFSFGIIYIAIQCILTLFLKMKTRTILVSRIAICIICTAAFVYHLITVPDNFSGISKFYFLNSTGESLNGTSLVPYPSTMGASLRLPIDTSGNYLTSAITEWVLVVFFCCFFFTFFGEAQQYSLLIVIETHSHEPEQEVSSEPNGVKKASALPVSSGRRQSEVRTFFRRDSTCQTMPESNDDLEANKQTFSTFDKDKPKYMQRQVSCFETSTGNKTENSVGKGTMSVAEERLEVGHQGMKAVVNGGSHPITNSTDVIVSNGGTQTDLGNGADEGMSVEQDAEMVEKMAVNPALLRPD